MTLALFVMLNNYFHDLATAVFGVSAFAAYWVLREEGAKLALRALSQKLVWLGRWSLVWVLVGGVVRALAYRDYECSEAAGKAQVPVLAVKHLVLFTLVALGILFLRKVKHFLNQSPPETP